jgi:hypothetical protein
LEFSICNVPANPFALAQKAAETDSMKSSPEFWGGFLRI